MGTSCTALYRNNPLLPGSTWLPCSALLLGSISLTVPLLSPFNLQQELEVRPDSRLVLPNEATNEAGSWIDL